MAKIPETFIKELKARTDLVKFVKQYTNLKLVGKGIWQGRCPHPDHNDTTPSFTVWEKTNSWCCYGCHTGKRGIEGNKGSDIYAFVEWLFNVNFYKAIEIVAEWNNIPMPTDENQKLYNRNYKLACKYQRDLLIEDHVIEYLYERGLDDSDISKWMIGFDRSTNRIVFPLFNRYKDIIGFNKRVVDKDNISDKYINSKTSSIFNKSKYFYGIHDIDDTFNEIRITEGSFDVVLARKYGVKNIVASLGTSFTKEHAEIIYKLGKTPVLIFDGDNAGNKGLLKALTYFEELGVYCKVVKLPKDKDLADIASHLKFATENYIQKEMITEGYLKVKHIIDNYMKSLYELKLKIMPKLLMTLNIVPLSERRTIKAFIKDELNITI